MKHNNGSFANCLPIAIGMPIALCLLLIANCLLPTASFAQNTRLWGTYYGVNGPDWSGAVAVDKDNNVYIGGASGRTGMATTGGFQTSFGGGFADAFLVKFDAAGNRLWATYYGGPDDDNNGSDATRIATDAFGNVFLAGTTSSLSGIASGGFQNTGGGISNNSAFLVKFDASGNRLWATYYGGGGSSGYSFASDVTTDAAGNIYLSGTTTDTSNIASGGFQNTYTHPYAEATAAFLVKFDANGNRLWSTYYGGMTGTLSTDIATDVIGNVYLAGLTGDTSGIASGGFQNSYANSSDNNPISFLVKFDDAGNRLWATYYPIVFGSIATDATGNVYGAGFTANTSGIAYNGFQNTHGGDGDCFLVKFDASGNRLWATYYGGTGTESLGCIATDASNNIYVGGNSHSTSNIAVGGFRNIKNSGDYWDAFLAKFSPAGYLLCSTYYGGGVANCQLQGVATDATGNVYGAGFTANTSGIAFGGFDTTLAGGPDDFEDAFLVKFSTACPLNTTISSTDVLCNGECTGTATAIPSGGTDPYTYSWSGETTKTVTSLCSGTYTVTVTDALGETTTASIAITEPLVLQANIVSSTNVICNGDSTGTATVTTTGGTPGYTYSWLPTGGTTITATALSAGTYTITVNDTNGCTTTQPVTITQPNTFSITTTVNVLCEGGSNAITITATGGTSAYTFLWIPTGQTTQTATGLAPGTYSVIAMDANGCTQTASIMQEAVLADIFVPNAFSPNGDGSNELECVMSNCIETFFFAIYDHWGEKVFETTDQKICWDGTYKGKDMDPAVFVYYVNAILVSGETINKKGNISLVR